MLRIFLLFILVSCASYKPLISRGLTTDERKFYVLQYGYGLTHEEKINFLNGKICIGMPKELCFQMYGNPDQTLKNDSVWEYLYKHEVEMSITFEDNKVISYREYEIK